MNLLTLLTLLSLFSVPVLSFAGSSIHERSASPIDVSGNHAFVAPDFNAGDIRGPCPGLNALANHGYIPHNGVVEFADVIIAINTVYGMGVDLATLLATMGLVWVGNPFSLTPSFSIGGATTAVEGIPSTLGTDLFDTPRGLSGSHNFIESDSSNTRDDYYVTGDASTMNLALFESLYAMVDSSSTAGYTMDVFAKHANTRWGQTVSSNPNFYYGPFTGLIARNAGYLFPARLFANYSSESLQGVLTADTLKSFFAISGTDGNFNYNIGHEQIPENWYRTSVEYSFAELMVDLVDWCAQYPVLCSIGGNTGTVNSFTGLDLANITGGIYDVTTLLKGNNLLCFVFEVVRWASPDLLSGLYKTLAQPLQYITGLLAVPLLDLECPALKDLEAGGTNWLEGIQDVYPGVAKSGGAL